MTPADFNKGDTEMKTTDLGNDWYYIQNDDGSAVVRNNEIGQRINLPKESVDLLRAIFSAHGGKRNWRQTMNEHSRP